MLTASADEHPDLFWALKGGGGNFGVVTDFTFRAHPVSTVLGGLLVWPRDRAGELLRFYRDFMARAPEELTCYCALVTAPDGHAGLRRARLLVGRDRRGRACAGAAARLRAAGRRHDPADALPGDAAALDAAFPDGTHNYWRASFVHGLTDEVIDTIVEYGNRMASPLSATLIEYYGGAAGAGRPGELRLRPARRRTTTSA